MTNLDSMPLKLLNRGSMMFGNRDREHYKKILTGYIETQRPNSQRAIQSILREWEQSLGRVAPWKATEFNSMHFVKLAIARNGYSGKVASSTVARKVGILTRVYSLMRESGLTQANPWVSLNERWKRKRQTGDKRPTELFPFDMIKPLCEAPSAFSNQGRMERCYFAISFGGALRVSEASNLKMSDVLIRGDGIALVLRDTKNGKDAEQCIAQVLTPPIQQYLIQRQTEGASDDDPFLTLYRADGNPVNRTIAPRQLRRIFDFWVHQLKVPGRFSPHCARATSITWLLELGLPPRQVRQFSRHASIAMLERYDKMRTGMERETAERVGEFVKDGLMFEKKVIGIEKR